MRKIGLGTAFRRDCKRIRKSGRGAAVEDAFRIVHALANDEMLPTRITTTLFMDGGAIVGNVTSVRISC